MSSAGIPLPENKVHYPALDGLRAVAVTMVFIQHYCIASTPPMLEWGWTGVDIFFVLSGFLITGILLDTVDAPHRFRTFYARRTLRIFPLYYGALLLVLLSTPLFHWEWSKLWLLWPAYLGNYGAPLGVYFSHGNFDVINYLVSRTSGFSLHFIHFWSLSVEEQFYLIWPLVIYKVRKIKTVRMICIVVIVAMPFARLAAHSLLPEAVVGASLLRVATFFRMDSFLVGGLIATLLRSPVSERLKQRGGSVLTGGLLALGVVGLIGAKVLHEGVATNTSQPWMNTFGFTFVSISAAGLLLLALRPGSLVYRVLTLWPFQQLGRVSYGFYVFHDIPMELYQRLASHIWPGHLAHPGFLVAAIAYVITAALAFLSFRYFETPFLRMKRRFTA